MSDDIINPFKQVKRTNWVKKTQDRLHKSDNIKKTNTKTSKLGLPVTDIIKKDIDNKKSVKIKRVSKSFKIYPGNLSRSFDKRVNKLQVHFDDIDYSKDYIDSGKYLMFLMSFAEKYELHDLYCDVDSNGKLEIDRNKLVEHFKKLK